MIPTKSDPTPFEEDLLRELRIERPAEDGARERVASRLGFVALAPGVPRDGAFGEQRGANATSNAAAFAGTRALGLASLTFVLGAAAGVTGQAWLDRPEVRVVYLERRAERARSVNDARAIEPDPLASSAPPASAIARAVKVPVAASVASSSRQELGPEVTMLDQARKALSEGHYSRAFELLGSHARLFPASILEQEREALTIKALVATGSSAKARARAQQFRARFPKSMLLDSVEKAVATIP
jgi:hypothetical protein